MQTYSSDPVADASRYYDAVDADQEDGNRRFDDLKQSFMGDALHRDLTSSTTLGETTIDFTTEKITHRTSKVAEVLFESLDYPGGPNPDTLIAFVVGKARGGDASAMSILDSMASMYAKFKAE